MRVAAWFAPVVFLSCSSCGQSQTATGWGATPPSNSPDAAVDGAAASAIDGAAAAQGDAKSDAKSDASLAVDASRRDGSLAEGGADGSRDGASAGAIDAAGGGRGVPVGAPWVSYHGSATQSGAQSTFASSFRLFVIDADPGSGLYTPAQITQLKAAGQNRVLSYLDVGSCENYRTWWTSAPGYVSCSQNTAGQAGAYSGFPSEVWMNLSNADYQNLIVGYVAPLLAAQGVDGFFLDNLEIVEHGTSTTNGPCDATCSQGGLDLVRMLRHAFPEKVIVMNNAMSKVTRLGMTGGVSFPSLLDGLSGEGVYTPTYDSNAEAELVAWQSMGLQPGGWPFWIGTVDYVNGCSATSAAMSVYAQSRAKGFSPYATDSSQGQQVVCYWGF